MPEAQGSTPTDKEVCPDCGKHRSTTVSGSDSAWVFKPSKCECAVVAPSKSGAAAAPAAPSHEQSSEKVVESTPEKMSEPVIAATTETMSEPVIAATEIVTDKPDHIVNEKTAEPDMTPHTVEAAPVFKEPPGKGPPAEVLPSVEAVKSIPGSNDDPKAESPAAGAAESVICSIESKKGQANIDDSGGWATDSASRPADKPSITAEEVESGSWVSLDGVEKESSAVAPRPFKTLPVIGPSGRSPSAIDRPKKSETKEDALTLSAVHDSSNKIGSSSGNNVSTISGSNISSSSSSSSSSNISSSSSSSGTGISSFNSISRISSGNMSSGGNVATASGAGKQKSSNQPEHWVPVTKKSLDTSQSQFKDDSQLFELIHQSEGGEEKEKLSTRTAIQQAFRRNRIKTLILAIVAIALSFGIYSYVSKTEAYKQAQAKALKGIHGVTAKKNSSRSQKKPKRNR